MSTTATSQTIRPFRTRWWRSLALLSLFGLLHGCSSFEFGVFAEVQNAPIIVVKLACNNFSASAQLDVTARVKVTTGSQSFGNVALNRVVMEYCVNPIVAFQTNDQSRSASKDSCESLSEPIGTTLPTLTSPCPFYIKRTCMPSLQLPRVLTCRTANASDTNSPCFVASSSELTYEGNKEIPLINLNEPGFQPRSNQAWGRTCCELGSESCTADADCQGRGTCQGRCQQTGEDCIDSSTCPTQAQTCVKLCDDLFQVCTTDSECPSPAPGRAGTCKQRCKITGLTCTQNSDCAPATQACLRFCSSIGDACTDDKNCAPGEVCKPPLCSQSGGVCSSNNDCPTGETCEPRTCIVSARLLAYVGILGDTETTYSQHGVPNRLRVLCQDMDGKPLSPIKQCASTLDVNVPQASICPTQ